jgi:hypothetical protein
MAQVNITHFADITADKSREFALLARNVAAKAVHGLEKSEIQPSSVSVLVVPIDKKTSLSGADSEVQVLVSGNNWPTNPAGRAANAVEAKVHFDNLAAEIHNSLKKDSRRNVYVWVTPFAASGWAEGK